MSKDQKLQYTENWNSLIKHLALNHCVTSTRDIKKSKATTEHHHRIWKECLNIDPETIENSLTSRNVFVIGSGASTAVNHNLFPTGNKAIDIILEKFNYEDVCTPTKPKLNAQLKSDKELKEQYSKTILNWKKANRLRSRMVLRAKNLDQTFETKLSLLSHFIPVSVIREAISQLFGYKTYPNLFYEILSYFLKNRFIDGIINFNFDELLDQIIEEEVGHGQLLKVVSDGDIPQYANILQNQRLKIPFYIKPHGTYSSKSSLRFTKEHYLDIPDEIETFMRDLFIGYETESKNQVGNQFDVLNLIVVGFRMESLEFNNVILEAQRVLSRKPQKQINLFYLEYNSEISKDFSEHNDGKTLSHKKKAKILLSRILGANYYEFSNNFSLKIIDLNEIKAYNLDNFITKTYHSIRKLFIKNKPKYIGRQLALIDFFQDKILQLQNKYQNIPEQFRRLDYREYNKVYELKDSMFFNSATYFIERTIFEILTTTFKNNGYIQLMESLKKVNRVGIYYHKYYEKIFLSNSKPATEIDLKHLDYLLYTFHDIMKVLNFDGKEASFNYDVYYFKMDNDFANSVDRLYKSVGKNSDHNFPKLRKIALNCISRFRNAYIDEVPNTTNIKFRSIGNRLMNTASIDSYPNYTDYQLNYFGLIESKHIIPTYTSLKSEINQLLKKKNNKWTHLFVVIDRAKHFPNKNYKNKKVHIIEANLGQEDPMHKNISLSKLPYFDHNRHMYIFMKLQNESLTPVKAIYYYKKGFSNNVNAICIDNSTPNNFKFLMKTFIGYYVKSINLDENKNQFPIVDSDRKLQTQVKKLKRKVRFRKLFKKYLKQNKDIDYQSV